MQAALKQPQNTSKQPPAANLAAGGANKWVNHKKITALTGYTYNQLSKYRARGVWLEGVQWIKNPLGQVLYNPAAIDKWAEGEL